MKNEMMNLAKAAVTEIVKAGASDAFMNADEETRSDMALAFVDAAIVTRQRLVTMYQTNSEYRDHLRRQVLAIL